MKAGIFRILCGCHRYTYSTNSFHVFVSFFCSGTTVSTQKGKSAFNQLSVDSRALSEVCCVLVSLWMSVCYLRFLVMSWKRIAWCLLKLIWNCHFKVYLFAEQSVWLQSQSIPPTDTETKLPCNDRQPHGFCLRLPFVQLMLRLITAPFRLLHTLTCANLKLGLWRVCLA